MRQLETPCRDPMKRSLVVKFQAQWKAAEKTVWGWDEELPVNSHISRIFSLLSCASLALSLQRVLCGYWVGTFTPSSDDFHFYNNPIASIKRDFHVICILRYILLTKQDMVTYEYKFHFGLCYEAAVPKKKKSMCIGNDFSLTLHLWMEEVCLLD